MGKEAELQEKRFDKAHQNLKVNWCGGWDFSTNLPVKILIEISNI